MRGGLSKLNHIIKQSNNTIEPLSYLAMGKVGQRIRRDKLFKSENLAKFGLQTSINTLFWRSTF